MMYGTFQDIFFAARGYYRDEEDIPPMDAVVRRQDGDYWVLESGLTADPHAEFECSLEDFHRFWSQSYEESDYTPTERDVHDFVAIMNRYPETCDE